MLNTEEGKITRCYPRNRCRLTRTCITCAKIRQCHAALAAERIFAQEPVTYLTVLKPQQNTSACLSDLRRRFLRLNSPAAYLWTIETGEVIGQLHLNIIHTCERPNTKKQHLAYHQRITTTPAHTAAYITKKSQRPSAENYPWPTLGASIAIREGQPPDPQSPKPPQQKPNSEILLALTLAPVAKNVASIAAGILLQKFELSCAQRPPNPIEYKIITNARAKLDAITKVYDCPEAHPRPPNANNAQPPPYRPITPEKFSCRYTMPWFGNNISRPPNITKPTTPNWLAAYKLKNYQKSLRTGIK